MSWPRGTDAFVVFNQGGWLRPADVRPTQADGTKAQRTCVFPPARGAATSRKRKAGSGRGDEDAESLKESSISHRDTRFPTEIERSFQQPPAGWLGGAGGKKCEVQSGQCLARSGRDERGPIGIGDAAAEGQGLPRPGSLLQKAATQPARGPGGPGGITPSNESARQQKAPPAKA